jgi:glycosyltransferase involved in cell wall biosynthesis
MRIAFLDSMDWDYDAGSPWTRPLGGCQSAMCYLAVELTRLGDEVFMLNNVATPRVARGVLCLPVMPVLEGDGLRDLHLDVLVVLNRATFGVVVRERLDPGTRVVLWVGHATDQPLVQPLAQAEVRSAFDGFALVSKWQRDQYQAAFGLDRAKTQLLRYCIAPAFEGLLNRTGPILERKTTPPRLAYTSTPFRGLDVLLEVFPRIRAAVPEVELHVFSDMGVYNVARGVDQDQFGHLYRACRDMPGVRYVGSLPQPELARELSQVTALAYPNTFPETSCISVMEAMAAGAWIVTSDLAALPETAAGFGRLVSTAQSSVEGYLDSFVELVVEVVTASHATEPLQAEAHLSRQVRFVAENYTWARRALEWQVWCSALTGQGLDELRAPLEGQVPVVDPREQLTGEVIVGGGCLHGAGEE